MQKSAVFVALLGSQYKEYTRPAGLNISCQPAEENGSHLHKADDLDAEWLHNNVAILKQPLSQEASMIGFDSPNAGGCALCNATNQHRNGPGKGCCAHILEQERA